MILVARLIEEAWAHRRQRQRATATAARALVVAALAIAGLTGRFGSGSADTSRSVGAVKRLPSTLVAGMAVGLEPNLNTAQRMAGLSEHCAVLNSVACDAFAVQLHLKRPAVSVLATVDGRTAELVQVPRASVPDGTRTAPGRVYRSGTVYGGVLLPLALRRYPVARHPRVQLPPKPGTAVHLPHLAIRLLITYTDGTRVVTQFRRNASSRGYDLTVSTRTGSVVQPTSAR